MRISKKRRVRRTARLVNILPWMLRDSAGSTGVGMLLLFAITITTLLAVSEFYHAVTLRESVDAELSRAVNTAVDIAMSDAHRQDHMLELDAGVAFDSLYNYLYDYMGLTPRLEAFDSDGRLTYALDIDSLDIERSPPSVRITATITLEPIFFGRFTSVPFRFSVRASSVNRRID